MPIDCRCQATDARVCFMVKRGAAVPGKNPRCGCACHPAGAAPLYPAVERARRAQASFERAEARVYGGGGRNR